MSKTNSPQTNNPQTEQHLQGVLLKVAAQQMEADQMEGSAKGKRFITQAELDYRWSVPTPGKLQEPETQLGRWMSGKDEIPEWRLEQARENIKNFWKWVEEQNDADRNS